MLIMLGFPHLKKNNWGHFPSFDAHLLQSLLASGKRCCSGIPRCLMDPLLAGWSTIPEEKTHDILHHYIDELYSLDHHLISRDEIRK
jgi:hypothetical protein